MPLQGQLVRELLLTVTHLNWHCCSTLQPPSGEPTCIDVLGVSSGFYVSYVAAQFCITEYPVVSRSSCYLWGFVFDLFVD